MRSRSAIEFSDVVAATFIVGKDLIEADFLTVPEAIANLPTDGGSIFALQGTYTLPASIVLPNKNVKIAGTGDSTVFVAPTVLPLFSIPLASLGRYEFDGFQVTGDDSVGQSLIDIATAVDVKFENVNTTGLKDIVVTSAGPEVKFLNSCFMMTSLAATSSFWRGSVMGVGGLSWEYVEATITTPSTDGIVGRPDWDVTASYIGGGGPLTTTFDLGKLRIQGFRTDKCRFILNDEDCVIVNLEHVDGNISIENNRTAIANSIFRTPTLSGTQISIFVAGGNVDITISGCIFDGAGVTGTDFQIELSDERGVEIVGCSFSNNGTGAATDANIGVGNTGGTTELTVVGCKFFGGNPAQALTESALGTIIGKYSDNLGFGTADIISVFSTVNGAKRMDRISVTTPVFVEVFTHENTRGLLGIGTIKNTDGVDSLDIKETVVDAFGVTASVTTTVLAGNSYLLDLQTNFATASPPYRSYKVEVKDTVAASPATFELHHVSQGAQ
jgi:hypothetical protein